MCATVLVTQIENIHHIMHKHCEDSLSPKILLFAKLSQFTGTYTCIHVLI